VEAIPATRSGLQTPYRRFLCRGGDNKGIEHTAGITHLQNRTYDPDPVPLATKAHRHIR